MTKKQAERWNTVQDRLMSLGIERLDVETLFRIERTLSRWSERECGDEHGNAIERDEVTGKPYATYCGSFGGDGKRRRHPIPDREAGALKRLRAVMAKYDGLWHYVQGDPRGCALYVGQWVDIPGDWKNPDEAQRLLDGLYMRGVAVCI